MFDTFDVRWIVGAFCLAAVLFAFHTYYHKAVLGVFVRALLESGAASPETAKTFAELDLAPRGVYLRSVFFGALRSVVVPEGGEAFRRFGGRAEDRAMALRFYIADGSRAKAEGLYAESAGIFVPVVTTAVALIFTVTICVIFAQIAPLFV